ncbi:MAG: RNA polymerase sigma factor [Gemmataceae bacterium]
MSRRYRGPEGLAANLHSWQARGGNHESSVKPLEPQFPEDKSEVSRLLQWTEFHTQVENLPEEQKAVFDLLWYQGLPQQEAAEVLGISFWTLRRHYRQAKVTLHEGLKGEWLS